MKSKTIILLSVLLCTTASLSAQVRDLWTNKLPVEVIAGINAGTRSFYEYYYEFGNENENLLVTNTLQTPSLNLGVNFKIKERLTLGAIATYAQSTFAKTSTYDNSLVKDERCQYVSLAPRIRYDWFTRKNVTLYSSFALGVGFSSKRDRCSGRVYSDTTGYVEATYVGIKVGRALFGFADLSSSSSGAMRIGIGYTFNYKRR